MNHPPCSSFRSPTQHVWIIGLLCLAWLVVSGCQAAPDPTGSPYIGKELWTATNLRLFDGNEIYWYNYLVGTILPVGTPVRLTTVTDEKVVFLDNYNREYFLYWKKPQDPTPFAEAAKRFFQDQNPLIEIQKTLAKERIDQLSIGQVERGMSKQTVLWSHGWPPHAEEPFQKEQWLYYYSKNLKKILYFEQGKLVHIAFLEKL